MGNGRGLKAGRSLGRTGIFTHSLENGTRWNGSLPGRMGVHASLPAGTAFHRVADLPKADGCTEWPQRIPGVGRGFPDCGNPGRDVAAGQDSISLMERDFLDDRGAVRSLPRGGRE